MKIDNDILKDALVTPGHISEADFEAALSQVKDTPTPVWSALVSNNMISEVHMYQIMADLLEIQYIDPTSYIVDQVIFNLIPEEMARHNKVAALKRTKEGVEVGMVDPTNLEVVTLLEKRFGEKVVPKLVTEKKILDVFSKYGAGLVAEFKETIEQLDSGDVSEEERDDMTVKIVDIQPM